MHRSLSHSHSQSKKSQIFSTKYMLVIFSMCHMQNLGSFLEYWYHLFATASLVKIHPAAPIAHSWTQNPIYAFAKF